jgi:hypothetical protein
VKQGKTFLQVTQLIPTRGDAATLQLFILIDDTLDSHVGNNLNDIREFISAQPATTVIAIGYMSNATVNIVQNFTPDHALAAKALGLPLATPGKKPGLQRVRITTELPNVEIAAPDNVWVSAGK